MIKINVRQEHIDSGEPEDAESCAITLALCDAFPEAENISVDGEIASIHGMNDIELPYEVQDFILEFDKGEWVQPFEFELEIE